MAPKTQAKVTQPARRSRNLEFAGIIGLFALFLSPLYKPISQRLLVLGVTRSSSGFVNIHGAEGTEGIRLIPDTVGCEDVHLHAPSGLLFAACQGDLDARLTWFPGCAAYNVSGAGTQGKLVVVEPKTFTSRVLSLTGFNGPLNPHGMDVISGEDPNTAYIFIINHLANPDYSASAKSSSPPEQQHVARSQIELFRHNVHENTAEHVRSIRHQLITTPNDVLATSPSSFYVTNDHYYRYVPMRGIEDVLSQYLAGWTGVLHVKFTDTAKGNPGGVEAEVVLSGMHTSNGLARIEGIPGREDEVLVADAAGGVLTRTWPFSAKSASEPGTPSTAPHGRLNIIEQISLDSCIDNPFWYTDPYASTSQGGRDSSGYILSGLTQGIKLADDFSNPDKPIPGVVWHVTPHADQKTVQGSGGHAAWQKRVLFQDDGHLIRSMSATVVIGIDPAENGGRKQGWLFVTGFASKHMLAVKVNL